MDGDRVAEGVVDREISGGQLVGVDSFVVMVGSVGALGVEQHIGGIAVDPQ